MESKEILIYYFTMFKCDIFHLDRINYRIKTHGHRRKLKEKKTDFKI
jgi:hypothetical protein